MIVMFGGYQGILELGSQFKILFFFVQARLNNEENEMSEICIHFGMHNVVSHGATGIFVVVNNYIYHGITTNIGRK